MKIFAQHGFQKSDKLTRGVSEGVLDGVIFSPRYVSPLDIGKEIQELRDINKNVDIYIDPEFYAIHHYDTLNKQLGKLTDWEYFTPQPRRLLRKAETVGKILSETYEVINKFKPTCHISPNIYIPKSFDSVEAVISLNFIEQSKQIAKKCKIKGEVYSTLAIDVKALQDFNELKEFLNEMTVLDNPPDGYYILVGRGVVTESVDLINSEIIDARVIAGWMFLNYTLKLNNFKIINGYSDILSVFLGAVGGDAGATGWWSKLRSFSLGNYVRSDRFGRRPNTKYLSKNLFNRISLPERENFSRIIQDVINNSAYEKNYNQGDPGSTVESLQNWEAIKSLNDGIILGEVEDNIKKLSQSVIGAVKKYASLSNLVEGIENINEYLDTLKNSIEKFKEIAEL